MREFSTVVDRRSRKGMIRYLQSHFRYYTANSWNGADSYACNMKLYKLGLPADVEDMMYKLLDFREFSDFLEELMLQFSADHDYRWTVRMNGRSGGYLVLYESEIRPSGYKSYCTSCGQRSCSSIQETGKICGNCGKPTRTDYIQSPNRIICYPGRGVDCGEDYSDWSITDLRDRVKLVQELDALADAMVASAVDFARSHKIVQEESLVPQTHYVLLPIT